MYQYALHYKSESCGRRDAGDSTVHMQCSMRDAGASYLNHHSSFNIFDFPGPAGSGTGGYSIFCKLSSIED